MTRRSALRPCANRAALAALAGVVMAATPAIAHADTWQKIPDNSRSYTTPEKVKVDLTMTKQMANRIVSVAPNQLSHMAWFSGIAKVNVSVPKTSYGPPDGILQVGYLVGCQADLSSGIEIGLNPNVAGSLAGTLGGNASVTPSISGTGGISGQTPNGSVTGSLSGTGGVNGSVSPSVSGGLDSSFKFTLKAGQVVKLVFGQRLVNAESSTSAVIQFDSVEVVVDQCGGDVKGRSFATFVGTTDSANVALNTRGAPVSLFAGV